MGRLTSSVEATCWSSPLTLQGQTVMKILAAICCLAVGASALVGPSGIVSPDGNNIQFTHDLANNVAVAGPSGIVTKDGRNIQLPAGLETLSASHFNAPAPAPAVTPAAPLSPLLAGLVGASGIVHPAGNTQFTREQAEDIVLIGPSGIVTKSGQNIQLRSKRHVIGDGGAVLADGTLVQFQQGTVEQPTIILEGPSGILWSNGQLTQKRAKRSLVGPSGIVGADGTLQQFGQAEVEARAGLTDEQNADAVVVGPSGIVTKSGVNVQFDAPAAPYVILDGPSGQVWSDGSITQKRAKRSLVGPSGIVGADGTLTQFGHDEATKRASLTPEENARAVVIGPSGIVNKDGVNTQFDAPAAPHVILDGPSGQVYSDGSLVQKVVKRSLPLCGPSGCILADGTPLQLPAGVTIASAGPSGVVLSNGQNIQFS